MSIQPLASVYQGAKCDSYGTIEPARGMDFLFRLVLDRKIVPGCLVQYFQTFFSIHIGFGVPSGFTVTF